ncbi:MAG TPA: hypothetical protein DDX14_07915, partial [Cyanobacteria bacterium UBA9579]|nr:hypothetical protein [Cyanobacteria bacterium UBA9579]
MAIGITEKAKAANNADSALTGDLVTHYTVTAIDGAGIIHYSNGNWEKNTDPSFTIDTNHSNYKIRISAVAGNSGAS